MSPHLPNHEQRLLSIDEQKEQAKRCSCRGVDDYCPCQNVPDQEMLWKWIGHNVAARLEYAMRACK